MKQPPLSVAGTDVSKEAAKMILVDDNFATIVLAVREGRRVWDNLVKILLYNMPVNFAQGFSVFMSYVLSLETVPLTAIQLLYVNMITSVTMGLMLAMEPAETTIMERPPRRRGKRLFGRMVMWHCIFVATLLVTSVLLNFQWELNRHVEEKKSNIGQTRRASGSNDVSLRVRKARACAFNMLVFGEIAFALNCRYMRESSISMKTLTGNKWCWIAIFITVALQVQALLVYLMRSVSVRLSNMICPDSS
jgi:magnesium-transporting ATPase (P-type)